MSQVSASKYQSTFMTSCHALRRAQRRAGIKDASILRVDRLTVPAEVVRVQVHCLGRTMPRGNATTSTGTVNLPTRRMDASLMSCASLAPDEVHEHDDP